MIVGYERFNWELGYVNLVIWGFPLHLAGEGSQCPLQADIHRDAVAADHQGRLRHYESGRQSYPTGWGWSLSGRRKPTHIQPWTDGGGELDQRADAFYSPTTEREGVMRLLYAWCVFSIVLCLLFPRMEQRGVTVHSCGLIIAALGVELWQLWQSQCHCDDDFIVMLCISVFIS